MQESDVQALCALAGSCIDKAYALALGVCQAGSHVFGLESDVMHTSAAAVLLYELGDGALFAGGFQKLQLNFANLEESSFNLLVLYNLDVVSFKTQYVLVKRNSLFQRRAGYADVFNL